MASKEISKVAIIGFNQTVRNLLKSTLSLFSRRGHPFEEWDGKGTPSLYIVDGDDIDACESWRKSLPNGLNVPPIFVGHDPFGFDSVILTKPLKWNALFDAMVDSMVVSDIKTPSSWFETLANSKVAVVAPVVKESLTIVQPQTKIETPAPQSSEQKEDRYSSKFNRETNPDIEKLLVVDDSSTVRHFMTLKLRPYGITIDYAEDGEKALELIKNHQKYMCIFLDVMMPGIDGYETCKRMRKEHGIKTPIVMITSKDSPFDKMKGQIAGCSAYLTKPIDETALLETASRFIARSY